MQFNQFEQSSEKHSGELEKELNQVATSSDLISTKMELKSDIKELEIRLIKWQITIGITRIRSVFVLLKWFY